MSLGSKKIKDTYQDVLYVENAGSGVDSTARSVKSGNGNTSSLLVGTNGTSVTPAANSTTAFKTTNAAGSNILSVDTTNGAVKVGSSQSYANTMYLNFGLINIDPDGSNHYGVAPECGFSTGIVVFGTGTDPSTPTFSNNAEDVLTSVWYVDTAIVLDSLNAFVAADSIHGDTCRLHLVKLVQTNTTISSFTSATVVADGSDISHGGYESIERQSMNITTSSIAAGTWLALTFKTDGTNSSYAVKATLKYHLA